MIVEAFLEPASDLAGALADFERQFTYPLGPGRSFRIEHGDDYTRFYRAAGEARCFVARSGPLVLGVLAVAVRPLLLPDGVELRAAYIGDLKVAPEARRGTTLSRLARAAGAWVRPRVDVAFGVVMDGTPAVPSAYTGRAGIPAFAALAHVIVFRFVCAPRPQRGQLDAAEADVRASFRRLSGGRYACPAGHPADRSSVPPQWLALPDGSACACLEDTRRAKRLIADDGSEMVSAHLSCFAWRDLAAGADLLRVALGRAAALGFPALFVAVPAGDAEALAGALQDIEMVRAPATVYGHGLPSGCNWLLNSSEI